MSMDKDYAMKYSIELTKSAIESGLIPNFGDNADNVEAIYEFNELLFRKLKNFDFKNE